MIAQKEEMLSEMIVQIFTLKFL